MCSVFSIYLLSDKIQDSLHNKKLGNVIDIIDDQINVKTNIDGRLKNGVKGKINSKLHIACKNFNTESFEQGNIYQINNVNIVN